MFYLFNNALTFYLWLYGISRTMTFVTSAVDHWLELAGLGSVVCVSDSV